MRRCNPIISNYSQIDLKALIFPVQSAKAEEVINQLDALYALLVIPLASFQLCFLFTSINFLAALFISFFPQFSRPNGLKSKTKHKTRSYLIRWKNGEEMIHFEIN
jgi:hypothetical protein